MARKGAAILLGAAIAAAACASATANDRRLKSDHSISATSPLHQGSRAFTVDPQAGTLRFGDGVRGARPPSGASSPGNAYREGTGNAGNRPGALNRNCRFVRDC